MKICTITCHRVYNHGASLQAYGLMKYLKNSGHDVEIIDYRPEYLSNHYRLSNVANPRWEKNRLLKWTYLTLKLPGRLISLRRKKAFDRFDKKYLSITDTCYRTNDELKQKPPAAEAYICGSDQIWNSLHQNGKDPAFYLDFAPSQKIKASYAASFATDSIAEPLKKVVKERVERLDGVAVREKSGVKILRDLGIHRAITVLDPVFLLDQTEWDKISSGSYKEDYILIYDFDNSELIKKIALELKELTGYKIYCVNPGKQRYADKMFRYVGPDSFISLIRDAKFVVSNSYHAAVFSLIYEKDFVIVNRTEAINTRMRDLLDDLNLNSRLTNHEYKAEELLKKIDYSVVKEMIKTKKMSSKSYLDQLLVQGMVQHEKSLVRH
ncbi:polysaccharide pyruvyl transferase family protein [Paenibacillus nanensis]|uniref:Polysaccharide pyruvyl transferase family protein n=1 Tax=Paenibacillus nanensis TaxID=393251 RepID=A0A3A1UVT8_9BACL|nr:polysaccharide pyruvyl transferase family protein [Paenibacillus nanensis]RIX52627.1 polysaccharide pyruvyl transferase family protein [Paenibacillus nanensis]